MGRLLCLANKQIKVSSLGPSLFSFRAEHADNAMAQLAFSVLKTKHKEMKET